MTHKYDALETEVGQDQPVELPKINREHYIIYSEVMKIDDPRIRLAIFGCRDPDLLHRLAMGFPECFTSAPTESVALPYDVIKEINLEKFEYTGDTKEDEAALNLCFDAAWDYLNLPTIASWNGVAAENISISNEEAELILTQLENRYPESLMEVEFKGVKCVVYNISFGGNYKEAVGKLISREDIVYFYLAPADCVLKTT